MSVRLPIGKTNHCCFFQETITIFQLPEPKDRQCTCSAGKQKLEVFGTPTEGDPSDEGTDYSQSRYEG